MNLHVLLVSAQAAPNLLAALDPAMKPDAAVMLVSDKMQTRADALEAVLKQTGVATSRIRLPDEHDFHSIENALLELAQAREGETITLNVTGGTKLMALAAQSVAQAWNWPVFYVDVDTDEVIWLGKEASPKHKLTEQLRLRHYLMGYGITLRDGVERPQSSQRHNALLQTLITQIGSLEHPITQINWLAQNAEDRKTLEITLTTQQQDSRSLEALLRYFEEAGVLRARGEKITFLDETQRDFAKGGWIEHYVFHTVTHVAQALNIRDKAINLKVTDPNRVENELDVAFMARNRLFVIECKTARMDKPEAPKANDTLFKLAEICKRVGGLGTRGMLASYRPLRDAEKRLAKALNIELVCGPDLARLDERLKTWVKS